jgi:hypothetical protein
MREKENTFVIQILIVKSVDNISFILIISNRPAPFKRWCKYAYK